MDKKTEQELIDETIEVERSMESASVVENVRQQVFDIVEELCLMPIQDTDVALTGDLSMDSLRMVMLLVTLEDTFEIELDESDMNPFSLITVQDVIDLVMKYVSPIKEATEDA